MLLTFFSSFYEWICGVNADSPEYNDSGIYDSVGLITAALTLLFVIVFYTLLGRWKPLFHKTGHWLIVLLLCACTGFGIAFTAAKNDLGAVDGYLIRFAIINAICTMALFFVLSVIFKRTSIFAKRTPF